MDEAQDVNNKPLLSIVIPTKDRSATCIGTVRALLEYDEPFELVVFDSSSDHGWLDRLPADPRVRVEQASSETNITQCFETAARHARGLYVCLLGDDDGVTPALFRWAALAAEQGWESLSTVPANYAMYNWPDVRSKYFGASVAGQLFLRVGQAPSVQQVDLQLERHRFLASAGQGCGVLPRVYHGLVSRDLLDRIRAAHGACFTGVSPDVSFSYLAAAVGCRHALVALPLTISGASASSNAGRSAMRTHQGELWTDPHMKHFQQEPWPAVIPEFFSVETVWAQASWRAIGMANLGEERAFDLDHLYAVLSLRHREHRALIERSRQAAVQQGLRPAGGGAGASLKVGLAEARMLLTKVARKAWRAAGGSRGVQQVGADSISAATTNLRQMMRGMQP
jgi:hypothetical protein